MPKNPMQDILPPEGSRSIRKVSLPEARKRKVAAPVPAVEAEETSIPVKTKKQSSAQLEAIRQVREEFEAARKKEAERAPRPVPEPLEASDDFGARPPKSKKWMLYVGVALAVVIIGILVANAFHRATVVITPKTLNTEVNANLVAKKNATANDLPFTVLTIEKVGSATVKASGEERVEKRASGTIVIYNNYSTASQRLIKNTRFETPEGLIYRIDQSVTVPGKKGTTPGSIEAVVYADAPGEEYNAGLKDFTIPGFKGDPRYTSFYAKSKPSSPLAGGFSGVQKVVSATDRSTALAEIEKQLRAELIREAEIKVGPDAILFDNAYKIAFVELPQESLSSNQVTIKEQGTLSAYVFDRAALSRGAARAVIQDYKGEPVLIENADELSFTPKRDISPATDNEVSFALSGPAHFVWTNDEAALKEGLIGKSKEEVPLVIQNFPELLKVDISMSPFWRKSFPDEISKITVKRAE